MSGRELQSMGDAHRECWESLPWLANERLSVKETARIGKHLQQCSECREELEAQQRLRDVIRSGDDPLVLAPQAGLQRLMARIEAEESRAVTEAATARDNATASEEMITAGRPMPARRRPWLAIAAAVQTIAIGVLLGTLWWRFNAPDYGTLTQPGPPVAEGPVLRVVFAETATLREINALLQEIGAQIVSGPSEDARVYTLVLGANSARRPDPAAAVGQLRADGRVVFAERAQVEGR